MSLEKPVRRIAIVGTGVIGSSWAAQYLARGFDVVATDPAPNAEGILREYVDDAWKLLTSIGLSPGASRDRLEFVTDMKEALTKADFVQENGPERPEFAVPPRRGCGRNPAFHLASLARDVDGPVEGTRKSRDDL